ncbi:hypothetical protein MPTK1_3g04150 [Marchantia polymorpha subsp. ruderalis]|uniref:Uncharacterized protein n=2 Tax=Marchantia polymorpha TaxID=3197 RepID=A0AAF6AXA4_MARPO|nr:hypothetical protein MARPO_0022s0116 [Marchantia polymorpha]BBN04388.1 hypothetical protein Mp_3g04150 [Marchantia polymorpha subsp. ruderalis]|eukprot:PTQ44015.1 hypothetical protein MARPO_0022s0116 [Marchantia polymorpha]
MIERKEVRYTIRTRRTYRVAGAHWPPAQLSRSRVPAPCEPGPSAPSLSCPVPAGPGPGPGSPPAPTPLGPSGGAGPEAPARGVAPSPVDRPGASGEPGGRRESRTGHREERWGRVEDRELSVQRSAGGPALEAGIAPAYCMMQAVESGGAGAGGGRGRGPCASCRACGRCHPGLRLSLRLRPLASRIQWLRGGWLAQFIEERPGSLGYIEFKSPQRPISLSQLPVPVPAPAPAPRPPGTPSSLPQHLSLSPPRSHPSQHHHPLAHRPSHRSSAQRSAAPRARESK